jgi:protein-S-isoprenylcysteine O-methyltransferase Ste14
MSGNETNSKDGSFSNIVKILTSFLAIVLSIIFINQFDGGYFLQVIGILLFLIGGAIAALGAMALGENFTLSHHPKGLVTNGIYSKIRHPMDYGGILLSIGFALAFLSLYGLILTLGIVTPLHIYSVIIEDKILVREFGERYKKYKNGQYKTLK